MDRSWHGSISSCSQDEGGNNGAAAAASASPPPPATSELPVFITTVNMGGCRRVGELCADLSQWVPRGGHDLVVVGVQVRRWW